MLIFSYNVGLVCVITKGVNFFALVSIFSVTPVSLTSFAYYKTFYILTAASKTQVCCGYIK